MGLAGRNVERTKFLKIKGWRRKSLTLLLFVLDILGHVGYNIVMQVIKIVTKGGHEILFSPEDATKVLAESWRTKNWGHTRYARRRNEEGKDELLHNFIMGKPPEGHFWDHQDRNGLNCRRDNLRLSTYSQNNANRKIPVTNKSGFRGVRFVGGNLKKILESRN